MKKIIIIILLIFVGFTSAYSQEVNKKYRESVKKMLNLTGAEENFNGVVKQMMIMVKSEKTNIPDNVWKDFEKEFLSTSLDEIVDKLAPIYVKYLTQDDIQKIIEFYQTPAGKKLGEKTTIITRESMKVGQQWGMTISQQIQDKLKEKGY